MVLVGRSVTTGLDRTGQDRTGQPGWAGLGWTGLEWIGLDWTATGPRRQTRRGPFTASHSVSEGKGKRRKSGCYLGKSSPVALGWNRGPCPSYSPSCPVLSVLPSLSLPFPALLWAGQAWCCLKVFSALTRKKKRVRSTSPYLHNGDSKGKIGAASA